MSDMQTDETPAVVARIGPATADPIPSKLDTWEHDPDRPTHRHWSRFVEWRKSACPPRDYSNLQDLLADLNRSTHEFVGAVSMLADLAGTLGVSGLTTDIVPETVLRRAGLVFFCGSWVADGWGKNPLLTVPDAVGTLIDEGLDKQIRDMAYRVSGHVARPVTTEGIGKLLAESALRMSIQVGKLAANYARVRWHARPVDIDEQGNRVRTILHDTCIILACYEHSVPEALAGAVKYVDRRWPKPARPVPAAGAGRAS
jgi:hypothetical protein